MPTLQTGSELRGSVNFTTLLNGPKLFELIHQAFQMIDLTFLLLVINNQSRDIAPQLRVVVDVENAFLLLRLNSGEKLPNFLDSLPGSFFVQLNPIQFCLGVLFCAAQSSDFCLQPCSAFLGLAIQCLQIPQLCLKLDNNGVLSPICVISLLQALYKVCNLALILLNLPTGIRKFFVQRAAMTEDDLSLGQQNRLLLTPCPYLLGSLLRRHSPKLQPQSVL